MYARIDEFPNYVIFKNGKVWSDKRLSYVKAHVNGKGYWVVQLFHEELRRTRPIHRLLAEAFLPNLEDKPEVNHINGDKLDNRLENLEWVTHQENIIHAYRIGLIKK